eukprot:13499596-Heterocapsa_arctica.AAC.1
MVIDKEVIGTNLADIGTKILASERLGLLRTWMGVRDEEEDRSCRLQGGGPQGVHAIECAMNAGERDRGLRHVSLDCKMPNIVFFVKLIDIVTALILTVVVVMCKSALEIGCAVLDKRSMKKPERVAIVINDSCGTQAASPAEKHCEQSSVGHHPPLDEQE